MGEAHGAFTTSLVNNCLQEMAEAILFKCNAGPIEEYAPGRGATKAEQRRVLALHPKSEVIHALERQAYKDGYYLGQGAWSSASRGGRGASEWL
jgi:hypothetical protein